MATKNFRFELVDKETDPPKPEKLGTYGVIQGTTTFVAGVMNKNYKSIEQYGYTFEKIILFLTDLNLGTCWLGASFERKNFSNRLHVNDSEFVPIVTPVGYAGTGINLHSTLVKLIARPEKRAPWETLFFSDDFSTPLTPNSSDTYASVFDMVRLAPSAGNMQPWRILKSNDSFHFFLKRSSFYTKRLSYDIQRNDIGIAMCHFELTARENGLDGEWKISKTDSIPASRNLEYIVSWNCK